MRTQAVACPQGDVKWLTLHLVVDVKSKFCSRWRGIVWLVCCCFLFGSVCLESCDFEMAATLPTLQPPLKHSSTSGGLIFENLVDFLDRIRLELSTEPEKYAQFLEVMRSFKSRRFAMKYWHWVQCNLFICKEIILLRITIGLCSWKKNILFNCNALCDTFSQMRYSCCSHANSGNTEGPFHLTGNIWPIYASRVSILWCKPSTCGTFIWG